MIIRRTYEDQNIYKMKTNLAFRNMFEILEIYVGTWRLGTLPATWDAAYIKDRVHACKVIICKVKMTMKPPTLILLIVAIIISTSSTYAGETPNKIHPLRPQTGSGGHRIPGVSCLSWRLIVETNNIRDWDVVPSVCAKYVGNYMLGHQYRKDCNAAAWAAYNYAKGLTLKKDGKDIWVFDIDETALSNLPYYARPDNAFGAKEYNETTFKEWELEGKAPAVPAILGLYNRLLKLGFKIVFISGKKETLRPITEYNMKKVGYHTWEKLILKQTSESGTTAMVYKSKKRTELEKAGYRILGNMGDQWSDLMGSHVGNRTFKVPNPMFYIA